MRSIGSFLKETRVKKKYSKEYLEEKTKIRKSFIEGIEREQWQALPEFAVVVGFVKSIAGELDADPREAVALLRRDYPPAKTKESAPKPDLEKRFIWGPRHTFFAGMVVVILVVLGYLGIEYKKFLEPPHLEVFAPQDGQVVKASNLEVVGKTDPEATVKINNQPAIVLEDGSFRAEIEVSGATSEVVVRAVSRSGKETVIARKIKPDFK